MAPLTAEMLSAAQTILILLEGSFAHAEPVSSVLHPCLNGMG
jgi:hypothetical protein